eukprot:Gb_41018 [translate_table: standard]
MKEGDRETRAVMKKKVVQDPEIREGRLIDMIMSKTLSQGTLMEGGLIIGIRETKKSKKENHINQRLLERIPIPEFDGINEEIKPRAWIGKLSYFFQLNPMGDYQKIQFATLHLEGQAFDWWQMMEREWDDGDQLEITTWNQFVTAFYHDFEAYTLEDYFLALKNMKQQSTMTYYTKELCQASLLVENISPQRVVSMYIDGLKDSLRGYVTALKPSILEEAIQQAEAYSEVAKSHFTIGTSPKTPQTSKGIVNSNFHPTSTARQLKSKMVDPTIITNLHLKGLCFNFKEKWSKGHKCKTTGKIHMIEILNEEHPKVVESDQEELVGDEEEIANIEDQEQQETLIVSLAAMLGITQYSTLESTKQGQGKNNGDTCQFQ